MQPKNLIPVIVAQDVLASARFYQQLGFTKLYGDEHYLAMHWQSLELHISPMPNLTAEKQNLIAGWTSFRIQVDHLDALAKSYKNKKVIENERVIEKEYGMKELTLIDPAGVGVTLFEEIDGV